MLLVSIHSYISYLMKIVALNMAHPVVHIRKPQRRTAAHTSAEEKPVDASPKPTPIIF